MASVLLTMFVCLIVQHMFCVGECSMWMGKTLSPPPPNVTESTPLLKPEYGLVG